MKSLILLAFFVKINGLVGCRQVVRHMVLVHAFGGSSPSTPAKLASKNEPRRSLFLFCCLYLFGRVAIAAMIPLMKFAGSDWDDKADHAEKCDVPQIHRCEVE